MIRLSTMARALRLGGKAFRLQVDTTLSHIYHRGAIVPIFKGAFGPLASPSGLPAAPYQVPGLPDRAARAI